jgi:hypothetical protein
VCNAASLKTFLGKTHLVRNPRKGKRVQPAQNKSFTSLSSSILLQ